MAFFDDDPPTQQRRASGPPPPPRSPRGPRGPQDPQAILTRRIVAIVGFFIVVLAVVLLLKGCVDTQRRNGLKDYNQQVNELGTQSISNVTQGLEVLSNKDGSDALAQRNALGELASDSDALTQSARELSTPGGLDGATYNLATALSLRATALDRISELVGKARGTNKAEQETATAQIAGQMSALMASDVLWQLRVTPFIRERFADEDLPSDSIADSVVLKDAAWMNTATVATRIGGFSAAEDTTTPLAPGTHGHGLASVTAAGTTLNTGDVPTTVDAGSGLSFVVTIENQGENDESDVTVSVTGVKRDGRAKVFDETKKVPLSKTGTKTPVTIPITENVTGSVEVTVEVRPVRGEENTDNNKQTYNVIFQ